MAAEFPNGLGMSDGSASLWFFPTPDELKASGFNRDATGISHFGVHVTSKADVDAFHNDYMKPKGIEAVLNTPQARADFGPNYYQVMFVEHDWGTLVNLPLLWGIFGVNMNVWLDAFSAPPDRRHRDDGHGYGA